MQEELKPCPFCGNKAKHIIKTVNFDSFGNREFYLGIKCINKHCRVMPRVNAINEGREECINAWNTRYKI